MSDPDLVDELRAIVCPENAGCNPLVPLCQCELQREAADEITHLRETNARLRAEVEHLRSALKPRVANISAAQLLAAWAAWDDCHDGEQANNPMRAALEASHLVFVRRALQIADQARAGLADQTGGAS